MRKRTRTTQRLRHSEAGSTAIEFAIISFVMILVSLGTIEFGRGLLIRNELSYAADLGARKVLMDSSISDSALESEIRSGFTSSDPQFLEITLGNETVDAVPFRTIAVSYPFTPLVPELTDGTINLTVDRRVPLS